MTLTQLVPSLQKTIGIMKADNHQVQLLTPKGADLLSIKLSRPFQPFSDEVLSFLNELSMRLCADPRARTLPDLYSFGFWCRRSALGSMRRNYPEVESRLGRGIVFHIAPSNVPVNFAYSLVVAMLAGNASIVRLPTSDFIQVDILIEHIDALLVAPEHCVLRDHIRLVRYERNDQEVTAIFSRMCDVRIIWGGDKTVSQIRQHAMSPRAFDITFADRYSVCIVSAEQYLEEGDPAFIAKGFYNDTYLFDQSACTAPHLILWLGSAKAKKQARQIFWEALQDHLQARYVLEPQAAVEKLATALRYAALHKGARIVGGPDNLITRVELTTLEPDLDHWRCHSGFFFEYELTNLEQVLLIVSRRYQTLSYFGFTKASLRNLITRGRALGIDRIVPIGRTLEFSLNWDGYDLLRSLSRVVTAG